MAVTVTETMPHTDCYYQQLYKINLDKIFK